MRDNTADYLRDESDHLPHDWELDDFYNQVDDLRDRADQLEERYKRLQRSTAKGVSNE